MIAGGLTKRGTIMSTSTARLTYYNGYLWHVVLLPGGTRAVRPSGSMACWCRARRRATTAGPPGRAAARTASRPSPWHRPDRLRRPGDAAIPLRISEADPGPDCAVFWARAAGTPSR